LRKFLFISGLIIGATLTYTLTTMNSDSTTSISQKVASVLNVPLTTAPQPPEPPFNPLTVPVALKPVDAAPFQISLPEFLKDHQLGIDQTLFITMADEKYVEPMVNFWISLDQWDLSGNYMVLCLDERCSNVAESRHILHYDGYFKSQDTTTWNAPVAKAKVLNPLGVFLMKVRSKSGTCRRGI
jgi:hypothetical protein